MLNTEGVAGAAILKRKKISSQQERKTHRNKEKKERNIHKKNKNEWKTHRNKRKKERKTHRKKRVNKDRYTLRVTVTLIETPR